MKKIVKRIFLNGLSIYILLLVFGSYNSIHADSALKTINTERGKMTSTLYSRKLNSKTKYFEYGSHMLDNLHTRLYLKSISMEYVTGKTIHSVPRFGRVGKTAIMDYVYLRGVGNKKIRTYSTHEAIWKNAKTTILTIVY